MRLHLLLHGGVLHADIRLEVQALAVHDVEVVDSRETVTSYFPFSSVWGTNTVDTSVRPP